MAYLTTSRRTLVFKTRWDSILLVVAASAVTLGLAATIHSRASQQSTETKAAWTGDLTDVDPSPPAPPTSPLTSASLVVPNSKLALPKVPVRALMKLRGCSGAVCAARTPTQPVSRPISLTGAATDRPTNDHSLRQSLMSRLNPLNHLPDVSRISRPISVASDAFQSWFR